MPPVDKSKRMIAYKLRELNFFPFVLGIFTRRAIIMKMRKNRYSKFAVEMTIVASSIGLAYLSYLIGSGHYFSLDTGVAGFILNNRFPAVSNVMVYLTYLGNFYVEAAVAGLAAVLFARKKHFLKAIIILTSVLGGELIVGILKLYLQRPRPPAYYSLTHEPSYGFPSGHAFAAVSLYGLLLYLMFNKSGKTTKNYAAVGWTMLAALIGFSRIYLGVHWTTDVLGGYTIGTAWVVFLVSVAGLR